MTTAEHRSTRYLILVDGDVAQANSRRVDALKRIAVIAKSWQRWDRIEVVDSWGAHPREVISREQAEERRRERLEDAASDWDF
jgi:hypothetical protein